jgi:hypothetical protein
MYVCACERKAWTIVTWARAEPGKKRAATFKCRSWRHEGSCRLWKGAQDFVRCKEAIASRNGWTYVVLTFDPKNLEGKDEAFVRGKALWSKLRHSLTRRFGRVEYIQTWEAHKSGWPHVNVLIHNARINAMGWKKFRRVLKVLAVKAGFGKIIWVEPMKSGDAMAGYLVKLARELTGATVKDQVPVDAPAHFRRLRASRGLLPAPHKNPEITGELRFKRLEAVEVDLEREERNDREPNLLASEVRSRYYYQRAYSEGDGEVPALRPGNHDRSAQENHLQRPRSDPPRHVQLRERPRLAQAVVEGARDGRRRTAHGLDQDVPDR